MGGDMTLEEARSEDAILNSFESAPNLTSVDICFANRFFPIETFKFPWWNFTSVVIDCVALIHVKPIMVLCPKLEEAIFRCSWDDRDETDGILPERSQLYANNKLRAFSLSYSPFDDDVSVIFMHTWVIPSLSTLGLENIQDHEITAMLQLSHCRTLRDLSLHQGWWTSVELFRLFRNTPLLTELLLWDNKKSENTFEDWLLRRLTYPEPGASNFREQLLPRLERFQYLPPESCTIDGNVMANMITSRSRSSPSGVAALRAGMAVLVRAHFGKRVQEGYPMLNDSSMKKLEKAQSEGMDVVVEGFMSKRSN
ncbi:hypothetical protein J3R30DRAFT_2948046 [Lentinula aciculospora]|uniref:Uncharacterized protein n=1 Tax=Lentinula aciculospora TaxID=153920 RepID=A0A9W8ZRK4_9AGAR|nr:hypothetical protein J3R30DRAFT_2948046 [Lentinula aciculospora]